jgi:hypothetical protein
MPVDNLFFFTFKCSTDEATLHDQKHKNANYAPKPKVSELLRLVVKPTCAVLRPTPKRPTALVWWVLFPCDRHSFITHTSTEMDAAAVFQSKKEQSKKT